MHMPQGVQLTNYVLINIVIRVGMVKSWVPGFTSQRALLRRQTCRILVLKGLPMAGRKGRQWKRGVLVAVLDTATILLFYSIVLCSSNVPPLHSWCWYQTQQDRDSVINCHDRKRLSIWYKYCKKKERERERETRRDKEPRQAAVGDMIMSADIIIIRSLCNLPPLKASK